MTSQKTVQKYKIFREVEEIDIHQKLYGVLNLKEKKTFTSKGKATCLWGSPWSLSGLDLICCPSDVVE